MWTVRAYAFLLALLLIQFGYSTIGAAEVKKSVPLKKPVANPTPVPQAAEKEAQPTAVADEESEEDSEEEAEEESEEESESTWALGATGQLLGTIIPTKFGAYADRVWDEELTSELAVVRGSISVPAWVGDIGSISETSVLLVNRSRIGEGKTSWIYGLSYNRFSIKVGDAIISRLSSNSVPQIDILESETLGALIGVGTRWQWDNGIHLNLDWFTVNQPLVVLKAKSDILQYVSNSTDRDNIDAGFKIMRHFPILTFFKLGLGYTF